jgi:predicted O-linked N-acetylglucosamine transferase (SPINDLY family)
MPAPEQVHALNVAVISRAQRLTNEAVTLMSIAAHADAVVLLEQATSLEPDLLPAVVNLATCLHALRRPAEARRWYLKAVTLNPRFLYARVQALTTARETCDFAGWNEEVAQLAAIEPDPANTAPQLDLLFLPLPAARLRQHAEAYARSMPPAQPVPRPAARRQAERYRIGYLSDELRDHVVGSLLVEVLELHDRSRFDIHLFDWGRAGNSIIERRIRRTDSTVHDIGSLDDAAAARSIAQAGIDLLVDLKGHTTGHRLGVMSARPAPVQVSWLGYPATLGGPAVDYLIADDFAVPPELDSAYAEQVIRLPVTLMPADRRRPVLSAGSRRTRGLPEDATVFCYLGKSAKITPDVFSDWLDIVEAVPAAVLWLRADGPVVRKNLTDFAASRGFPMDRLVTADDRGLRSAELNGRYLFADLALDTFPYGSHTTASEALWAGCPIITRAGETLPSRIAGSLLRAVGLDSLVLQTREAYRERAVELGRNRQMLLEMRSDLERRKASLPAFDTPAFTRGLESAFALAIERHRAGHEPQGFDVPRLHPA